MICASGIVQVTSLMRGTSTAAACLTSQVCPEPIMTLASLGAAAKGEEVLYFIDWTRDTVRICNHWFCESKYAVSASRRALQML